MFALHQQLEVRPARREDLPKIGRIWSELMQMHYQVDDGFALAKDGLQRWHALASEMIGREDGFVLVAEVEGRPIGFCLGWVAQNPAIYRSPQVGFISEIAVVRSERRRGVGRALFLHARQWFAERGLDEFQLSTAVWNEDAMSFWEAVGGKPFLVRYRFDTGSP